MSSEILEISKKCSSWWFIRKHSKFT